MTIEAIEVPTSSRVWSAQDAQAAYDLLTGIVRNEDGTVASQDADNAKAAKYGLYDEEGKARSQGMSLDRLIKSNHGRRFGVSVWKDADGKFVGALLPREPVARKAKAPAKSGGRSK